MTTKAFIDLALSFPGTVANPHFDRTAFKVEKRRIFATLHQESQTANFKFSKADQATFCDFDKKLVYPIANKWGEQGWTTIHLAKVPDELVREALQTAYREVFRK